MIANYYVWTAYTDQAYGGPEEGGWWYDTGTPVQSGEDEVFTQVQAFETEADAFTAVEKLRKLVAEANKGRRHPNSVLSSGDWMVGMMTNNPPASWPTTRPRYE